MKDWRSDVRSQLQALHTILTSPTQQSDVPLYVLETLLEKIPKLICSHMESDDIRWMVRGAFHAAGDAGFGDDDDPVIKQLLKLDSTLPVEE